MYIPDFWVGVGATLLVEFIVITIFIIIATHNGRRDDE